MFELEIRVGVGERNWRFENLVRNTVVCLTQSTLSSQSKPKTHLRALCELRVSQLGIGIGIGNISTLATFTSV